MMTKVIRPYTDKYTGESVEKGSTIEMTTARFDEINSTHLGIFVEEEKVVPGEVSPLTKEEASTKSEVDTKEVKSLEEVTAPLAEKDINSEVSEKEAEKKKAKK